MGRVPRPKWPEDDNPYDFSSWDKEQLRRAGELIATISLRQDANRDARSAILRLYMLDMGLEEPGV